MNRCCPGNTSIRSFHHVTPSPSTSLATRHWFSGLGRPLSRPGCFGNARKDESQARSFFTTPHVALQDVDRGRRIEHNSIPQRKPWTPVGDDFVEEVSSGRSSSLRSTKLSRNGREDWQTQKASLEGKFKSGWNPRKKLSPDAQDGIRALNAQQPDIYTTSVLAEEFQVSPEAIRRILKSKWRPSELESADRHRRWENRGLGIWAAKTAMGQKPPRRWRDIMNEKVQENGREAAIGLIKGPVAQAMLARDIEEKNKARQERSKISNEARARMMLTSEVTTAPRLQSNNLDSTAAPKRRGRPRKVTTNEADERVVLEDG